MTNPALDALDKMEQRLIELCAWHEEGEIEQQAKTIRTALANAPQWQPIETAPKDRSLILLWISHATEIGYADEKHFYVCNNGDYWDGGHGNPYRCTYDADKYETGYSIPTHWMPLPAAPNGGA